MTEYPSMLPVDALLVLRDKFTGKPVDNGLLGLAAWNVAGFGMGLALPPATGSFGPNTELALIETVLAEGPLPVSETGAISSANPLAWLALVKIALEILEKLRG